MKIQTPCYFYTYYEIITVLTGVLPWQGYDVNSIRHQIVSKGRTLPIPNNFPSILSSVLSQGLVLSRQKRTLKLKQIQSTINYLIKVSAANCTGLALHFLTSLSRGTTTQPHECRVAFFEICPRPIHRKNFKLYQSKVSGSKLQTY